MFLEITGFPPLDDEDDLIQFALDIDPLFEQGVMEVLGWESLEAEIVGDLQLTAIQIEQLSVVIHQALPRDLDLFIGVRQ